MRNDKEDLTHHTENTPALANTNQVEIKFATSGTARVLGMKKIYPVFLLFLAFPALSDTVGDPCGKIEISRQVAQCAEYKKDQSDKILNLSYKSALDRIRHQHGKALSLADQYISLLRGAQREWIKLRDADCKLEAFEIEETAEAYQVTINNCMSRMSVDRANYLSRIATDI